MHDVRLADRFEVFVENDGATNSWTARYENSNVGVQVHRVDAICRLSRS
jgi:hypothetical protein